jgi:glycosyltransferase involved in cell wall biosynthesis
MNKVLVYSTQLMQTGGIESHILEFCKNMSSNGVEIDLVVPNFQMSNKDELLLKKYSNKLYINRKQGWLNGRAWLLRILLLLSCRKYTALYTNGQGESVAFLEKFVLFRKIWVHHHHTSGDKHDQATWGKGYRRCLGSANELIACSTRNKESMQRVLHREIKTIPCFSREILIPAKSKKESNKLVFGYYGRLIPEKGIDVICKLSEDPDLKNIEFHIWGEGKKYPAAFFNSYPQVKYRGTYNTTAELIEVIGSLDAYILLSIHPEGLPISLLEIMSAGKPWLATDRGGIPDIACDKLSTRVISHKSSYEEMKHAILELASDIKAGVVSSDQQKGLYQSKFSSDALYLQWSDILFAHS